MPERATRARFDMLAGLIEKESRQLGLLTDDETVVAEPGSKLNGINWGVWVTRPGGGYSDTLGIGHLSRDLPTAIARLSGYFEALRTVSIAKRSGGVA